MLLAGDEMGRTQMGNNNGYCQDNEISWVDWENRDEGLLEFTRRLIDFRIKHPIFRRRGWFLGRPIHRRIEDITWFTPGGEEMTEEHWKEGSEKSMAVFLNGMGIAYPNHRGERVVDKSFLVLFNAHFEGLSFSLPSAKWGKRWKRVLDTSRGGFVEEAETTAAGEELLVESRSLTLLMSAEAHSA